MHAHYDSIHRDDSLRSTITLGSNHAGLRLTIEGTLLWVGDAPANDSPNGQGTPTLIRVNGARGALITIDGSGLITTKHEPCQVVSGDICTAPSSSAKRYPGFGIRITDSDNVTVSGVINGDGSNGSPLRFQRLSTAVLVEAEQSNVLTFKNLDIKGMSQYGIFIGAGAANEKISGVTIHDCHVQGAYDQHGFRVYASNVEIKRCSSCRERASGVWVVHGKNILIDDFDADTYVRIGPNHECDGGGGPEKGERVINAEVMNINADHIEVQSGVIGCWLHDLALHSTNDDLSIGRGPGGNSVARPNNRIHWRVPPNTDVETYGETNDPGNPTGVNGTDISPCPGDVDDGGTVDVSDLLAVINAWGPCDGAGSADPMVGACWFQSICHPHWTSAACASAGGTFRGLGTDCWTDEARAPCCVLSGSWTCTENVLPSACWDVTAPITKKYLGNLADCTGVNCVTATPTMPACTAAVKFPQFLCAADIAPPAFGNWAVDVVDLLLVLNTWGCTDTTAGERAPEEYFDCDSYCAGIDPTYGATYASCMEDCTNGIIPPSP